LGITIKDIAKLAGVSTSTVSLVLSGKGYVSDTTRLKVQKIIDEYHYRPLRSAQQLASNRTGNIGFIISDLHLSRSEAFYSRVLLGAELEARNQDVYLLLSTVGRQIEIPKEVPRFLESRNVDGIIVAGSVPVELVRYIHERGIPLVLIDFKVPELHVDSVVMDNRAGVQQVVDHLVGQGIERIGFVGGSYYHPSIQERFEGYQLAMERAGLGDIARNPAYRYLEDNETTVEIGAQGVSALLKQIPDLQAVICVNDTTATGCLQQIRRLKKRIPEDIIVVGFDDVNYAAVTHPPLTTVHVPKVQMGVEGIKLLMDRMDKPHQVHQTRLIPVELVVRESSQRGGSHVKS
jgi:LacI family transcriptional regulator